MNVSSKKILTPRSWNSDYDDNEAKVRFIIYAYLAPSMLIQHDDNYAKAYKRLESAILKSPSFFTDDDFNFCQTVVEFYSYL